MKHLDILKGHHFLMHKKTPLASKEWGLIVLSERRGFTQFPWKMLLLHLFYVDHLLMVSFVYSTLLQLQQRNYKLTLYRDRIRIIALDVHFLPFFYWENPWHHPSCVTSHESSLRSRLGVHELKLWERKLQSYKIKN